jgi:AcrR family transcriptional regulator
MGKRAELVDQTRRRITEAAVRLHTSVGPSATSMTAVAEEAGVTRLTLYRHFPNGDLLFAACMSHWRAQHPPPDPDAWRSVQPFGVRVRRAVADVYRWYEQNAADLYPLYRDAAFTPQSTLAARKATIERMVDAILDGATVRGRAKGRLRALAGHALGFWTWWSLHDEQGLRGADLVEVATAVILAGADSELTETESTSPASK